MSNISIANGEAGSSVRTKLNYLFDKARNGIHVWDYMSATQRTNAATWQAANDCTAAINSAIADLPTTGGVLFMPIGRIYTQGAHAISVPCAIIGYGKAPLSLSAPTLGATFIESGVDGASVFTFATSGLVRGCSFIDTISATRTGGDAIVAYNASDYFQRVDCLDNLFYGFWNQYNGRVSNSNHIAGNDFEGALNFSIIVDNEVSADAGDGLIERNAVYPGISGKTSAGAIKIRNGGNKIIGNAIVPNAGTVTTGIVADIRTGTSQVTIVGNKVEGIAAEAVKVTYTTGSPANLNYVIITGNILRAGGTAAAINCDLITTFLIGDNTLGGSGAAAVVLTNSSSGVLPVNQQSGFTANYSNTGTGSSTTKIYWDTAAFPIGGNTVNDIALTSDGAGNFTVKKGDLSAQAPIIAASIKTASPTAPPTGIDIAGKKAFFDASGAFPHVYNNAGSNYGMLSAKTTDQFWFGTTVNGTTTETTKGLGWGEGGNALLGAGALATGATNGFSYLPTIAGTPSGVPTSYTGHVAACFDTAANKLWVYNGAWKSVTLA